MGQFPKTDKGSGSRDPVPVGGCGHGDAPSGLYSPIDNLRT